MEGSTTRLGVVGWPVAHSRSPAIQNAALAAVGLTGWRYQLLPIPPEVFAETVVALPDVGFRGVNVTIPHKEAALAFATDPTPCARAIGAANALVFEGNGRIVADNTDAPGLIGALPFAPAGRSALVLGAGGSARAVVWALLDAGAREVRIWNRTPKRAQALAAELGGAAVDRAAPADLLVNCTASGLDPSEDTFTTLPIAADDLTDYGCVVDLVYGDSETPLVQAARARQVRVVRGRELLVRQGALSFELFTGRRAPIELMRRAVEMRHGE
ncbi:MAG: shikimate dehydrogenase [Solirubrobacterales bacterium]|nr:shikimate dehydrogenase [Solirubrobacterales bacterium]MBV9363749.1 shikimate dehydrogenase [Solirubrobacterales bacterium]MBV9682690.1 shikimate dehydrogenase [Solirubrobacterales bacterium]MBV9807786.1 shikimate dehydrogenase [Solirubrobacterales bacterium]